MSQTSATTDMLSIQLRETEDASGLQIRAVDLIQPNFRHRLTFNAGTHIREALIPEFATYIEELIDALDSQATVFSEPDAVVELPGLILGKIRVLAHRASHDARSVTIRFTYFIGSIQSLFSIDTCFSVPSNRRQDTIAIAVLIDICTPAFEMISTKLSELQRDAHKGHATGTDLAKISEVESELSFYLHLLQCYIASLDVEQQIITPDDHSPSIPPVRNLELKSV